MINIIQFTTPIGPMVACASEIGLSKLEFTNLKMDNEFEKQTIQQGESIIPGENKVLDQVQYELEEYFLGKRKQFTVLLDSKGTEFQQKVWTVLQQVPYGETRTYMQQANMLQNPKGIRAVAAANGQNPIAIIIPCHRIIGANGKLTGYAGGLDRKKWLIDHEAKYSGKAVQAELDFSAIHKA